MNREFSLALERLNKQQRQAVETIDGPLLVIAGPGTGKTEMLALRAAQILSQDGTMLPNNILCLTFTDNASDNMRRRLVRYIGQDAYRVAIHTFNSFGQYIMNAYPEYFFEWREMQTADELTTHRILEEIMEALPGNHILAARGNDGTFYAIRQLKNFIADAKKNNLTPGELKMVLAENMAFYEQVQPLLQKHWPAQMNRGTPLADIDKFINSISPLKITESKIVSVTSAGRMFTGSLENARAESEALEGRAKTRPYTAWKDLWLEKNADNQLVFKAQDDHEKLMAAIEIYQKYQGALETRGYADFNDQIMWVLRTLQEKDELRYNLQERFQYAMIDEFQDTNRAQLLLAQYVTDAPVHEGRPNIMVVGDDDQAIFRFQGADIGNIGDFESRYKKPHSVTLVKNYRSTQQILDASRRIGQQITLSLEKQKQITKELVATVEMDGIGVALSEFDSDAQHNSWVASTVADLLKKKVPGSEIAILARERDQLDSLVPYLRALDIAIDYERSENVLQQEHILALLNLARLVNLLSQQQLVEANALLPSILSEPMWQIETADIWRLSEKSYKEKRLWLDVIFEQKGTRLREVADFFVGLAGQADNLPAEQVLDRLVGISEEGQQTLSPFKQYFFGDELFKNQPANYLALLSHLATLRRHLGKYQASKNKPLVLADLIEFVDSYNRVETLRMIDISPHREASNAVKLMTVHGAKGLEFDNVFLIAAEDNSWTKTGRSNRFSYPENLKIIKPADSDSDDSLRLLFVAMTRARHSLQVSYYLKDEDGRSLQPYSALLALDMQVKRPAVKESTAVLTQQYEQRWLARHSSISQSDMRAFLEEKLERYKLSPTHMNDFLNVHIGGPLYFLTQHLLKFPSTKPTYASYGSAMHAAISEAHKQIISGKKMSVDKVITKFLEVLEAQPLSVRDLENFKQEGETVLRFYLEREAPHFKPEQKIDVPFTDQGVIVAGARLEGNIDLMDLDGTSKTVAISDYKTGSPESKWNPPPSAKEHERIKMHNYKNQLMFYKLLVDNAADWGKKGWQADAGYLRFLKQNSYGKLNTLSMDYTPEEMSRFKKLVASVWLHIQDLDFPDTSEYPATIDGIEAFEADLLK